MVYVDKGQDQVKFTLEYAIYVSKLSGQDIILIARHIPQNILKVSSMFLYLPLINLNIQAEVAGKKDIHINSGGGYGIEESLGLGWCWCIEDCLLIGCLLYTSPSPRDS